MISGTHESNLQLEMVRGKKHLDVAELEVQLRNSAYRTRNFNLSNELKVFFQVDFIFWHNIQSSFNVHIFMYESCKMYK